jgi:SAM-dependent methyltransferase
MKVPESEMPNEQYWESLFDIPLVLDRLEIGSRVRNAAELGCGYGTFTIPVARRITGVVRSFDIDPTMVARTRMRAAGAGLDNVQTEMRDVFADGFGLPEGSCDVCLLFNILHCLAPEAIMREARRVVRPGGDVMVIHWRSDVVTPRGPPLAIRPRPETVRGWARAAGLNPGEPVELPPWHFGMTLTK